MPNHYNHAILYYSSIFMYLIMSDIIIIIEAAFDYVESWFDKASQIIAVRSKTDKSPSTNKTMALDVHAKLHQLENAVRVKQERKARTQSRKREKTKRNLCKKSQSARHLRSFIVKSQPCEVFDRCLYRENCEDCPLYGDLPF